MTLLNLHFLKYVYKSWEILLLCLLRKTFVTPEGVFAKFDKLPRMMSPKAGMVGAQAAVLKCKSASDSLVCIYVCSCLLTDFYLEFPRLNTREICVEMLKLQCSLREEERK